MEVSSRGVRDTSETPVIADTVEHSCSRIAGKSELLHQHIDSGPVSLCQPLQMGSPSFLQAG